MTPRGKTTARPTRRSGHAAAERAWQAMQRFVGDNDRRAELRGALGLGPVKVELLLLLADAPLTLREIAAALAVDPSAATVAVDTLQNRGLVRREPHPDDARRKLVSLTDAGLEAAERGRRILLDPPDDLNLLPTSDLDELDRILTQLNAGRSEGAEPG